MLFECHTNRIAITILFWALLFATPFILHLLLPTSERQLMMTSPRTGSVMLEKIQATASFFVSNRDTHSIPSCVCISDGKNEVFVEIDSG